MTEEERLRELALSVLRKSVNVQNLAYLALESYKKALEDRHKNEHDRSQRVRSDGSQARN